MRLVAAAAALMTLVSATPAAADPAGADLAVTVAFDKPAYFATDTVHVTVTVTNLGTAPATGVTLWADSRNSVDTSAWTDFQEPGTTVEPGEQVVLPATIDPYIVDEPLRLAVEARSTTPDTDTANNTASVEAPVTVRMTDLTGRLYRDIDGDRQLDPGEELVGVQVAGQGGRPITDFTVRTDAAGRFTARNVPEGQYALTLGLPTGWQADESQYLEVRPDSGELLVRAVRDSSALRASITFDKPSYAVGDTIRQRVTLTNTGTADLGGVTSRCVEGAAPNQLSGLAWGDLVHDQAPGVTVRAGETRTWEFTDVVPPGGRLYGFITITCWFSTAFRYDDGPAVLARAEVPGGRGSSGGLLHVDRDGDGFYDPAEAAPGITVRLVAADGRTVARAVTDAAGHFMFADVPANRYDLRLVGGWRLRQGPSLGIGVYDGAVMDNQSYAIEPGPNQLDPDLPRQDTTVDIVPAPEAPAAPPRRPADLADTGANVVELIALGMLLLVAGSGLLLVRRRSKEAP